MLGIENGFTPAAADITGKRFAASGSTQSTTREMIHERFGQKIGNEKLRRLTTRLATSLEPLRQDAQRDQLIEWIEQARQRGGKTVLSPIVSEVLFLLASQPYAKSPMSAPVKLMLASVLSVLYARVSLTPLLYTLLAFE